MKFERIIAIQRTDCITDVDKKTGKNAGLISRLLSISHRKHLPVTFITQRQIINDQRTEILKKTIGTSRVLLLPDLQNKPLDIKIMNEKNYEEKKTDRILLDQNGVFDYIFTYKQRKRKLD